MNCTFLRLRSVLLWSIVGITADRDWDDCFLLVTERDNLYRYRIGVNGLPFLLLYMALPEWGYAGMHSFITLPSPHSRSNTGAPFAYPDTWLPFLMDRAG